MSLFGRLEDMPLEDIVQILSMAKRTGKLALTHGQSKAVLVFKDGDIVYAVSDSVRETLGNILLRHGLITDHQLQRALEEQKGLPERVLLGTILVDMGAVTAEQLKRVLIEQIEEVVCELLGWKAGVFRFEPVTDREKLTGELKDRNLMLTSGASPEQLVLEAYRRLDESRRDGKPDPVPRKPSLPPPIPFPAGERGRKPVPPQPEKNGRRTEVDEIGNALAAIEAMPEDETTDRAAALAALKQVLNIGAPPSPSAGDTQPVSVTAPDGRDVTLLRSILEEIRSPSFTGEISLMILRFAAETLPRAVLFAVKPSAITVIGEFGLKFHDADGLRLFRSVAIPPDEPSVLRQVIETRRSYRGPLPATPTNELLIGLLGGVKPREVVVVPMIVAGKVIAILYGDAAPDQRPIGSIDCLELLMIHASLGIEKTMLERRVDRDPRA